MSSTPRPILGESPCRSQAAARPPGVIPWTRVDPSAFDPGELLVRFAADEALEEVVYAGVVGDADRDVVAYPAPESEHGLQEATDEFRS